MADSRAELRAAAIQRFRSVYRADEPTDWDAEEQRLDTVGFVAARDIATAAIAEVAGLRAEVAKEQSAHEHTMVERDRNEEAADALAYAIADHSVIGEHSNANDPWANAVDVAAGLRAELEAATARADRWQCIADRGQGQVTEAVRQLAEVRRTLDERDEQIKRALQVIADDGCYCEHDEPVCANHLIEAALKSPLVLAASRSPSPDTENSGEQSKSDPRTQPHAFEANSKGICWCGGDEVEDPHLPVSEGSGEVRNG